MALRALAGGRAQLPGDPDYDSARHGFALAVDQYPAAVAYPQTAAEIATAVRVAADHGLRVAVWSTGHDPAPLGDLRDTLLLRADRMRAVSVDPDLIWALRGGGASVGIVTELEFEAFAVDSAYGGALIWDVSRAEEVLPMWADRASRTPNAWARLQRLRATYDPRGVLHTPHAAPAPVGT